MKIEEFALRTATLLPSAFLLYKMEHPTHVSAIQIAPVHRKSPCIRRVSIQLADEYAGERFLYWSRSSLKQIADLYVQSAFGKQNPAVCIGILLELDANVRNRRSRFESTKDTRVNLLGSLKKSAVSTCINPECNIRDFEVFSNKEQICLEPRSAHSVALCLRAC